MIKLSAQNKRFWEQSKPMQRVAVAKDVIKQINAQFLIAKKGVYLQAGIKAEEIDPSVKLDKFFDELKTKGQPCTVCGIGACFVSLVNLGNSVNAKSSFSDISCNDISGINDDFMRPKLRKVFTPRQLTLIECAFERESHFGDDYADVPYKTKDEACDFGYLYPNASDRLIAIMQNIIDNEGFFRPDPNRKIQSI
jgi:hypothetical protein